MYNLSELSNHLLEQIKAACHSTVQFIKFATKRAQNDMILRVASSLSYTSLIAIVPLCVIMVSIFSFFPVFENIKEPVKDFLASVLVPTAESEFSHYFAEIPDIAGKVTAVGVAGLAITSILMLATIENSLNFIFKVTRPRRLTTKITLYWTVITLGPILFATAFSMRGYLYTLQKFMPENLVDNKFLLIMTPSMITLILLMLIYIFVPNKKVSVSSAFVGGTIAVIIFSFLRKSFTYIILKSATYRILYGALAIIPIFLVWIYLAWAVVILGAVITAALDEFRTLNNIQLKKILIRGNPEKRK
ncbi:MAG: YihY family inner membrane protein [Alphaproteobacteria bacterium]|nr:YihY family inner membrane protein [Alphaproteobacteria bacterium]